MKVKHIVLMTMALAAVALLTMGADAGHQCTEACGKVGCSTVAAAAASLEDYSEDEMKVVKFVADWLQENKLGENNSDVGLGPGDIAEGTGLSLAVIMELDQDRLLAGIMAELQGRGVDTSELSLAVGGGDGASCAGACAEFGACSVDANLAGASGELLEKYQDEKDSDGEVFIGWKAPDFTLPNLEGEEVSLSDFRSRPVALVFLARHCNHCVDTAPFLKELAAKYDDTDLVILPVLTNAGSIKAAKHWAQAVGIDYPLLVSEGKEVSSEYNIQLVPSTLLINADGWVTKKLVTFQTQFTLDSAFRELVATDMSKSVTSGGR